MAQGHCLQCINGLPGVRWKAFALAVVAMALAGAVVLGGRPVRAADASVAVWKVYPPGWNLVAGPAGSHIAPLDERVISLDGVSTQYAPSSEGIARAGVGYWVLYPHGAVLLLIGVPQNVSQTHVSAGQWATIGNSSSRPASVRGADLALTYDPDAGFAPAGLVQPGQAALVYASSDADIFMDPFSKPPPRTAVVPSTGPALASVPPFPASAAAGSATPADEMNYLIAVSPLLADVSTRLGDYADNFSGANPAQTMDPVWQQLRDDASGIRSDLDSLQQLTPPARYVVVQADLVAALADSSDGMTQSIAGSLVFNPERTRLGAGLLASGVRRLGQARGLLPQ